MTINKKIDKLQEQFSDEKIAQAAWDFLKEQCLTDSFDIEEEPEITTSLGDVKGTIAGFWVKTWMWVPISNLED